MAKINLPKAPEIKVNWGIVDSKCERDFKDWIEAMIVLAQIHPNMMSNIINDIYEDVKSLGYEEGYDNGKCDSDPEGW